MKKIVQQQKESDFIAGAQRAFRRVARQLRAGRLRRFNVQTEWGDPFHPTPPVVRAVKRHKCRAPAVTQLRLRVSPVCLATFLFAIRVGRSKV